MVECINEIITDKVDEVGLLRSNCNLEWILSQSIWSIDQLLQFKLHLFSAQVLGNKLVEVLIRVEFACHLYLVRLEMAMDQCVLLIILEGQQVKVIKQW